MKNILLSTLFVMQSLFAMGEPHPWDLRFHLGFNELFPDIPGTESSMNEEDLLEASSISQPITPSEHTPASLSKKIISCPASKDDRAHNSVPQKQYQPRKLVKQSGQTHYSIGCELCPKVLYGNSPRVITSLCAHYTIQHKGAKPPSLEERHSKLIKPAVEYEYACSCPYCPYTFQTLGNNNAVKRSIRNHITRRHGKSKFDAAKKDLNFTQHVKSE